MYFIEGFCLYTKVGSSGRGVLTTQKGNPGPIGRVPVDIRRTLKRRSAKGAVIGGGYWRRQPRAYV